MLRFLQKSIIRDSAKRWTRKKSLLAIGAALLLSPAANAQMSGTYTVCASGCNYSSITAAITALRSAGINGKTTIEIKPGAYNTNITISSISGTSATNTLTFKGTGTANTDVRIYSTNSPVVAVSSMRYVILENMHIEQTSTSGQTVLQLSSSSYITVRNNRITAPIGTYLYPGSALQVQYSTDNLIENNHIRGGGYMGIDMYTTFSSGNNKNVFKKNLVTKWYYYAFMCYYGDDNLYQENTIDSGYYTYAYGDYHIYENRAKILKNTYNNCYYGLGQYQANAGQSMEVSQCVATNSSAYGAYSFNYGTMTFSNNMIHLTSAGYYGMLLYNYATTARTNLYHNTIHLAGTNNYNLYLYNYQKGILDIRNNNITRATSGILLYLYQFAANDIYEGNNWYNTSGTFAQLPGTSPTSFSAFQAAFAQYGQARTDQSMSVKYISSTDLHIDKNSIVPFGKNIGINVDIDNDSRCQYFATSGADESSYSGSPHYAKPSGTKFTGPSTAYNGNPTTYFNAGKVGPYIYKWYVDGVWVSDSAHLTTTALKSPSSKVKLVAINCGGRDSMEMTVTVKDPPTKPTSDFISDLNTIRQNAVVKFTDLSTGYPSSWKWEITPKTALVNNTVVNTYKYTYGDTFKNVTMVQFLEPGIYTVCLTASNVKGTGNKECKVAYIEVQPALNVGQVAVTKAPSGFMYDTGGPNNDPTGTGQKRTIIDPCASDVWLVFNYFDMMCGYYHVRIYDGTEEKKGKELHPCTTASGYGANGGFTGGNTYTGCYGSPCRPATITQNTAPDTFHAKSGKMLIIQENTYSYSGYGRGFEATWWSKPTTEPAPTASFTSVDSICTNGVINFTNTSKGTNMSYLWDLDGDGEWDPSSANGNATWPYFFPGNVTITLVTSNCGGSDTFQKTIKVYNPASPTISFTADNRNPTINDIVYMTSSIPECADEYLWTITHANGTGTALYVNGTKNTSAHPQLMFTDTGCYSVELYVKNVTGDDKFKLNCYIRVREAYCTPSTMNMSQDLGISYVEFNTIKNKSSQGTTAYTSFVSNQSLSTTVEIGVTYPLTIERTTNKNKATRTAWIDWNQNGIFEASEKVAEETNATTLSWTKDIIIPATAKVGATVMRIAITQGSQTNDPCGPLSYGEYEDYRLYVRPDLTAPVITMLGDDTVYVEQGYTYTDAGATAVDNLDGNITNRIVEDSSKFSSMIPKTYIWSYNVKDAAGNAAITKKRVVIVTPDVTAPELEVATPDTVLLQVNNPFTRPMVMRAFDLVDGDLMGEEVISGSVINTKVGDYVLTYSLTDFNQNTTVVTRIIRVIDTIMPTMALVYNQTVQHEVGTPYVDSGVTVNDNYYSETELRDNLVSSNNIDVNKVGVYSFVYVLKDPYTGKTVTVTRTVEVVDTQAPVLSLNGKQKELLDVFDTYQDKGVTITDNYYKTLNSWDTSGTFYQNFPDGKATKLGTYTIIYRVTDPSGNTTDITREIEVVDRVAPVIKLKGEQAVNVCRWSSYTDAGYEVSDNYWPTNTLIIKTEGSFTTMSTALEGVYTLRYVAADSSGNVAWTATRNIFVRSPYEFPCSTNVGIKDAKDLEKAISVYPNPNSGKFTVEANLPANEQVKLTVTNMMGQEVAVISNGSLQSNKFTVDLSNQASGVYLLNVTTANHTIVKRIVVNK